ncbi:MAG: hypothetical protein PHH85_14695 [Candidatus Methanoperedens sp.]|nr:hypothetical protein [Candidatus Methanoperedens sp.]
MNKEKIMISGAILIISIIFIIIGIIFGGVNPILRLFFIVVSFFYLPVLLFMEMVYSIIPSVRPDMDTMTASQFYFQFGLMFVLGCVYVYLVSCAIVFVHRRKKFH